MTSCGANREERSREVVHKKQQLEVPIMGCSRLYERRDSVCEHAQCGHDVVLKLKDVVDGVRLDWRRSTIAKPAIARNAQRRGALPDLCEHRRHDRYAHLGLSI